MLKLIIGYLLIIFVLAFPRTALADDSDADKNTKNCPKNLQSALESINTHLRNKQWVNINHHDCPQIQTEIIHNVDKIVKTENLDNYLPLMNKDTLKIVRNAFFAIKGYKFKDTTLQEHFTKYTWYQPTKESVNLTDIEKQKVNMIKNIEDNWIMHCEGGSFCRPPQPLPSKVRIEEKHGRKLLYMDKAVLDITRTSREQETGDPDRPIFGVDIDFAINGIANWNAALVCSQEYPSGVDAIFTNDIILYSNNGKELFRFNNRGDKHIGGLERCPFWIPQRPDILISYNHAGCCGARWDILAVFNKKIEPIGVINCGESNCSRTELFYEISKNDVYYYMESSGTLQTGTKNNVIYYDYNYDLNRPAGSDIFISSLWLINKDGNFKLISEAKNICYRKYTDSSQGSWESICNKPEPIVDLFPKTMKYDQYPHDIATSINLKDKILLFLTGRNNATTIVPLAH